jgi:hypothetical protein
VLTIIVDVRSFARLGSSRSKNAATASATMSAIRGREARETKPSRVRRLWRARIYRTKPITRRQQAAIAPNEPKINLYRLRRHMGERGIRPNEANVNLYQFRRHMSKTRNRPNEANLNLYQLRGHMSETTNRPNEANGQSASMSEIWRRDQKS